MSSRELVRRGAPSLAAVAVTFTVLIVGLIWWWPIAIAAWVMAMIWRSW